MDTTLLQGYELGAFLYAGLLIGFMIEANRFLLALFPNRFYTYALDVLLLVSITATAFLTFYLVNGGEFRFFGCLGIFLGCRAVRFSVGGLMPRPKPLRLYRRGKPVL